MLAVYSLPTGSCYLFQVYETDPAAAPAQCCFTFSGGPTCTIGNLSSAFTYILYPVTGWIYSAHCREPYMYCRSLYIAARLSQTVRHIAAMAPNESVVDHLSLVLKPNKPWH
jgi:hypothetical protein